MVVFPHHGDIFFRIFPVNPMADHFKDSFKICSDHHVIKICGQPAHRFQTGACCLQPLPCVFLFHGYQPVHKITELRAMGSIQQQTEFVKVVVDVIHHSKHRIRRILPNLPSLDIAVKRMECFLHIQTPGHELF